MSWYQNDELKCCLSLHASVWNAVCVSSDRSICPPVHYECFTDNHDFICAGPFQMDRPLHLLLLYTEAAYGVYACFCSPRLLTFDQKYCHICEISIRCKTAVLYVNICDQSCIFSIITQVFSVTWSSEIIIICKFAARETFLIIIDVENSRAAQYFCGNWCILFFRIHRLIESSKEQRLFKTEIVYHIINVFTCTFYQFFHSSSDELKYLFIYLIKSQSQNIQQPKLLNFQVISSGLIKYECKYLLNQMFINVVKLNLNIDHLMHLHWKR